MKKGKSEVIIVIDRSGSMQSIKTDIEGGLKTFIDKQKLEQGECFVSLYSFDDTTEKVFECKDIKEVKQILVEPRGSTALFDALGKAINEVGERLNKTDESERPEVVIFLALTDGGENASKEFKNDQIKEMIKTQETVFNWKFVYLGANQDAFASGQRYGFSGSTSMTYGTDTKSIIGTFDVLVSGVSCMRAAPAQSYSFSPEQRAAANQK